MVVSDTPGISIRPAAWIVGIAPSRIDLKAPRSVLIDRSIPGTGFLPGSPCRPLLPCGVRREARKATPQLGGLRKSAVTLQRGRLEGLGRQAAKHDRSEFTRSVSQSVLEMNLAALRAVGAWRHPSEPEGRVL